MCLKTWIRSSQAGYVSKFELHQKPPINEKQYDIIGDTVLRLCEGLENESRKLPLDTKITFVVDMIREYSKYI
uniref:Uncharacterized protein n=1 Tax=Glossina palpalis gambiensis TaxID=67801 RepID=A0A1B0AXC7_9MUSC